MKTQITFNLLQLMVLILSINIILYGSLENLIQFIKSTLDINTPEFWFVWIHMAILYIILIYTEVELGLKFSIKFTL